MSNQGNGESWENENKKVGLVIPKKYRKTIIIILPRKDRKWASYAASIKFSSEPKGSEVIYSSYNSLFVVVLSLLVILLNSYTESSTFGVCRIVWKVDHSFCPFARSIGMCSFPTLQTVRERMRMYTFILCWGKVMTVHRVTNKFLRNVHTLAVIQIIYLSMRY